MRIEIRCSACVTGTWVGVASGSGDDAADGEAAGLDEGEADCSPTVVCELLLLLQAARTSAAPNAAMTFNACALAR
jgi:hypothetical protein